jgi:hypothetical protein
VLGTEIEATFLLKIGTIFKALVDKNPYSKVQLLSTKIEDFCCQKKAIQYSCTTEIWALISRLKSGSFSEGLWHRFRGGLLVLFTSYCCTFNVDNDVVVKLRNFLLELNKKNLS